MVLILWSEMGPHFECKKQAEVLVVVLGHVFWFALWPRFCHRELAETGLLLEQCQDLLPIHVCIREAWFLSRSTCTSSQFCQSIGRTLSIIFCPYTLSTLQRQVHHKFCVLACVCFFCFQGGFRSVSCSCFLICWWFLLASHKMELITSHYGLSYLLGRRNLTFTIMQEAPI